MYRDLIEQLKNSQSALLRRIQQKLAVDGSADVSAEARQYSDQAELLETIQAGHRRGREFWLIIINLLLLLALTLWLLWDYSPILIHGHLRASRVTVVLDEGLDVSEPKKLASGVVGLSDVNSLRCGAAGILLRGSSLGVSLEADSVRLQSLHMDSTLPGSTPNSLTITALGGGQYILELGSKTATVQLAIFGRSAIKLATGDEEQNHDFDTGKRWRIVDVQGDSTSRRPLQIFVSLDSTWQWPTMMARRLSFPKEPDETRSPLEGGEVDLPQVEEHRSVRAGEFLLLGNSNGTVGFNLRSNEALVDFEVETKDAASLTAGDEASGGYRRRLALSRLEYFYHNKLVVFWLSLITAAGGILWNVKRYLAR